MKCQDDHEGEHDSPHRNAITIHTSSTRSTGSFHQSRCSGGLIAIVVSARRASGTWVEFHHAPEDVSTVGIVTPRNRSRNGLSSTRCMTGMRS